MNYRLRLEIPGLTPMNTADGPNRWTRRRARKKWETWVWGLVSSARKTPAAPLERAHVTITRHSSREPDYDALVQGGKFLLDGLVKAGVLLDDRPAVIGQPEYHWVQAPPKSGRMVVTVQSVVEF